MNKRLLPLNTLTKQGKKLKISEETIREYNVCIGSDTSISLGCVRVVCR